MLVSDSGYSMLQDCRRFACSLIAIVFISDSSSRFNFRDETPTTNFDTFPAAILTVFQVKPSLVLGQKRNSWASPPVSGEQRGLQ